MLKSIDTLSEKGGTELPSKNGKKGKLEKQDKYLGYGLEAIKVLGFPKEYLEKVRNLVESICNEYGEKDFSKYTKIFLDKINENDGIKKLGLNFEVDETLRLYTNFQANKDIFIGKNNIPYSMKINIHPGFFLAFRKTENPLSKIVFALQPKEISKPLLDDKAIDELRRETREKISEVFAVVGSAYQNCYPDILSEVIKPEIESNIIEFEYLVPNMDQKCSKEFAVKRGEQIKKRDFSSYPTKGIAENLLKDIKSIYSDRDWKITTNDKEKFSDEQYGGIFNNIPTEVFIVQTFLSSVDKKDSLLSFQLFKDIHSNEEFNEVRNVINSYILHYRYSVLPGHD